MAGAHQNKLWGQFVSGVECGRLYLAGGLGPFGLGPKTVVKKKKKEKNSSNPRGARLRGLFAA